MPIYIENVPHDGARKLVHDGEPDGSSATVVTNKWTFAVEHTGTIRDGQRKFSPIEETLPQEIRVVIGHSRNLLAHAHQASSRMHMKELRRAYETGRANMEAIRGQTEAEAVATLVAEEKRLVDNALGQPVLFGRIAIGCPATIFLGSFKRDLGTVLSLTPHSPR